MPNKKQAGPVKKGCSKTLIFLFLLMFFTHHRSHFSECYCSQSKIDEHFFKLKPWHDKIFLAKVLSAVQSPKVFLWYVNARKVCHKPFLVAVINRGGFIYADEALDTKSEG
jgi:hypothetical protein